MGRGGGLGRGVDVAVLHTNGSRLPPVWSDGPGGPRQFREHNNNISHAYDPRGVGGLEGFGEAGMTLGGLPQGKT